MFSPDDLGASADAANPADEADDGSTLSSEDTTSPQAEEGLSISRLTISSVATKMFSPDDAVASADAPNPVDEADDNSTLSSEDATSPQAGEGLSISRVRVLFVASDIFHQMILWPQLMHQIPLMKPMMVLYF